MFENAKRYRVEFLTPNRGSDDNAGRPANMPALGGASAQPLRFLDFLIHDPVRVAFLHGSGSIVTVPAPERYAVQKLFVASRRTNDDGGRTKRDKDARQADILFEALAVSRRQSDLASAYSEAYERGPAWREALNIGMGYLPPGRAETAREALARGFRDIGEDPDTYGVFDRAPAAP